MLNSNSIPIRALKFFLSLPPAFPCRGSLYLQLLSHAFSVNVLTGHSGKAMSVLVLFIPSLVRVRRPCRELEKFFPPVLQRCYGCSFHAQEIVHTGHGMLGYYCFFFFWRERCLPKVSWKSNPAAPGLANQVWPFKSALCVPGKTLMVGWGLLAHASGGHLRWSVEGWACLSSFQLKGLYDRTRETHS